MRIWEIRLLGAFIVLISTSLVSSLSVAPEISPATGLKNQFYSWKADQQIRFQCNEGTGPPLLLIHGLFVNSDHWRKTLTELKDYRVYALDLLGCGYSTKPTVDQYPQVDGEVHRFGDQSAILKDQTLGTAQGGTRIADVDLRHPLQSPYNFFTWSDLVRDFTRDIVLQESSYDQMTLVCNSIGTISTLQAMLDDTNDMFKGAFVVCPNFRELHVAEVPLAAATMPVIRLVQRTLREYGQGAFDALAKPDTVAQILKEPYERTQEIDDTLVKVLLDPLLLEGSSKVVFDTLSYSAGPLPEQQLAKVKQPVWVCYGKQDPWTPGARVENLQTMSTAVEKVVAMDGVGHCPHDEAPELVHPLLLEFLSRLGV